MPLLPDPIIQPNIKKLILPQPSKDENGLDLPVEKRAYVKMDVRPTDGADITQSATNLIDPFGGFLVRRIVEWNFVDESGVPMPINYDNVLRIGKDNIAYLAGQELHSIAELTDDQKKTSTSTLTQ